MHLLQEDAVFELWIHSTMNLVVATDRSTVTHDSINVHWTYDDLEARCRSLRCLDEVDQHPLLRTNTKSYYCKDEIWHFPEIRQRVHWQTRWGRLFPQIPTQEWQVAVQLRKAFASARELLNSLEA